MAQVLMTRPIASTRSAIHVASRWLKTCLESHSGCSEQFKQSNWVPSRLLRLQRGTCGASDQISLQESSEIGFFPAYLTLSHCWGKLQHICLIRNTFLFFRGGAPALALPQTFQDAIDVTLRLGYEYLWIDSLCIFQDSRQDWLEQSSQMSRIYSKAVLNLAASSSEDGTGGLYYERDPRLGRACAVNAGHQHSPRYICCYDWETWSNVDEEVLNKRAWVLQERALARRVLHFTRDQLWWECNDTVASEAFPVGVPPIMFNYSKGCRQYLRDDHYEWIGLISGYSECSLSKAEDKLIALSGVAREFASSRRLTSKDYLAGLWAHELPANLLWYGLSRHNPNCVFDTDAPSWSWASTDAHLDAVLTRGKDPVLDIVEVNSIPLSDPFGKVVGGHIKARGNILKVFHSEIGAAYDCWQSLVVQALDPKHKPAIHAHLRYDERASQEPPKSPVYSLPIAEHGGERRILRGLIIKRTKTIGEYRRVGVFDILDPEDVNKYLDAMKQQRLETEDFENVEDVNGDRRYTICLV